MSAKYAHYETDCGECMTYIAQDDPIWFGEDGIKLCRNCAAQEERICLECDGSKKPQYERCWECGQRSATALRTPGFKAGKGQR